MPPSHHHTTSPCGRETSVAPWSSLMYRAVCAASRVAATCCATVSSLLPFPLQRRRASAHRPPRRTSPSLLREADRDGTTAVHLTQPSYAVGDIACSAHLAALTGGADTIEDAIGSAFESKQLLFVLLHSELSPDSAALFQSFLSVCLNDWNSSSNKKGREEAAESTTLLGVSKPEAALDRLKTNASWYVMSFFSDEFSYLPVGQNCAAPAVVCFAPVGHEHGMSHLGRIDGPLVLQDVFVFVAQCQDKWKEHLQRQLLQAERAKRTPA